MSAGTATWSEGMALYGAGSAPPYRRPTGPRLSSRLTVILSSGGRTPARAASHGGVSG